VAGLVKRSRARWPRKNRLTRSEDIRMTIRQGQCLPGGWFRLFFRHGHVGTPRFAVSVRKTVGQAYFRNRERRRLRESLRTMRHLWPERGWGVVVIDRAAPPQVTAGKRQDIIRKLLEQVN
jgi:ribonuclease P protein component